MAQNIDSVIAKLKELQGLIPGVETNITRLQTLLKASFEGGSGAAVKGVTLELENMALAADRAISKMSNVKEAQSAMAALQGSVKAVKAELSTLTGPHMPGTATPVNDAGTARVQQERIAFEKEYQSLVQQGMAEPKAKAEAIAREQSAKVMKEQLTLQERLNSVTAAVPAAPAGGGFKSGAFASNLSQSEREYQALKSEMLAQAQLRPTTPLNMDALNWEQQVAPLQQVVALEQQVVAGEDAATAAARAHAIALDQVVARLKETYGIGSTGQFFTKSELTKNLAATSGGTRALRQLTGGEDAEAYFARMLKSGEIAQQGAYKFKFTELNTRDLEEYEAKLKALGNTAAEVQTEMDRVRGVRLTNAGGGAKNPLDELTQEQQNIMNLTKQGGGLRSLFGSDEQFTKFQSRLKELKLDMGDVKRATTDVASGLTTVSFETLDESLGVLKTATLYVDEFGRVVTQGTSRVKSLETMITSNITKVMGWALALGVVYGSMQKIGELVQSMRNIQESMVDIGITTQSTAKAMDSVYEAVLQVSQATSTDLVGGLTSVNQALRATASSGDQFTRIQTGVKLLADSLTLAKLSGMETKRAMDTLIAGLKQLDLPLSSGAALLDKFQAISNIANTSMEDMATTFAITAGAADDAGVNVNNLVAMIGAFSEATSLTATETGNALRAMFSNFAQPQAVEVLNKYGIAVQDINGEFRSFIDVFTEASNMARSGVLSERQVAEIANALGGGSRRQAQVTALLTVAPRQQTLRDFLDQGKEAGAAQSALEQKTGTLNAALERLQNSFDNLAKSLGNEGGFISVLTTVVDLLSKVIDLASSLTKSLGPGLPLLLAGMAGFSLLKTQGPVISRFGSQLGAAVGSPFANMGALAAGPQPITGQGTPGETQVLSTTTWTSLGTTFGKNAFNAMLPILPLMVGKVAESTQSGDWSGTIGMGVGAAFMGVISGNPIWALVGGLIGQAVVESISNNQKVIANAEQAKNAPPTTLPANATPEQIQAAMKQSTATLSALGGADQEQLQRWFVSRQERLRGITADESLRAATETFMAQRKQGLTGTEAFNKMQGTPMTLAGHPEAQYFSSTAGFSQATLERAAAEYALIDTIKSAVDQVKDLPAEMGDQIANKAFMATKSAFVGTSTGIKAATTAGEIINTPEYEYNRNKRYEFTSQLAKGDLTTADYKNRMEALGSSGLGASLVTSALHPNIDVSNVQKYKDEWLKVKDALTVADAGTATYIQQTATNLTNLNQEMSKLRSEEQLYERGLSSLDSSGFAELETRIKDVGTQSDIAEQQIRALLQAVEDTNNAAKFSFKGFGDYSKYSRQEMSQLIATARGLQEIYANQTNTPLDQLIKTAPDIVTMTKEGFNTWGGVYQQFLDQVLSNVDTFRSQMEEKMKFNFKSLRNVPAEMAQKLQQAMNYYTNLLKQYGFNERNDLITVLFKDNQVGQLVGSQTALQLALEDLTEVEKKKLDGIYNLPTGATAYIPLQAGQLLSEYSKNTEPQWARDYGATPTAPPKVGTYPNGKPPSEMSTEELFRMFLLKSLTPLQAQAQALSDKYMGVTGKENLVQINPNEKQPWQKSLTERLFGGEMGMPGAAAPTKAPTTPEVAALDTIANLTKQLYGIFAPFLRILTQGTGFSGLFPEAKGKATSEAAPVKINITQEKQTQNVNVQMAIQLDSRRLWEGIKKIALEDYSRLTASVGESTRSRGNVL